MPPPCCHPATDSAVNLSGSGDGNCVIGGTRMASGWLLDFLKLIIGEDEETRLKKKEGMRQGRKERRVKSMFGRICTPYLSRKTTRKTLKHPPIH